MYSVTQQDLSVCTQNAKTIISNKTTFIVENVLRNFKQYQITSSAPTR